MARVSAGDGPLGEWGFILMSAATIGSLIGAAMDRQPRAAEASSPLAGFVDYREDRV
jgi:hypothetical protein